MQQELQQQIILFYLQIASAIISTASLIALVVYVVKTWEMATATRKSAEATEKSVSEMREARDNESAPYVVAFFEVLKRDRQLYLVIKNTGKNVATNVKVAFSPNLQSQHPDLFKWFLPDNGIPSLPPGHEIRTIVADFPTFKISNPMEYRITICYFGGISSKLRITEFDQNLYVFRGEVYMGDEKSDVAKEIEKMTSIHKDTNREIRSFLHQLQDQRTFRNLRKNRNF